jgi:hypothetical protein
MKIAARSLGGSWATVPAGPTCISRWDRHGAPPVSAFSASVQCLVGLRAWGARNGSHDRRPPTSTSLAAAPVASSGLPPGFSFSLFNLALSCSACLVAVVEYFSLLLLLQVHICMHCKYPFIYILSRPRHQHLPGPEPAPKATILPALSRTSSATAQLLL